MILLLATSLTDWSWGDTWVVTGLGFGIVLLLLFCLVFILMGFGWVMQRLTNGEGLKSLFRCHCTCKQKKESTPSAEPTDEDTKAAIAMALASAGDEDKAAIAYALYLAHNSRHDLPTSMIKFHGHETAWNEKTFGLNNKGF